MGMDGKFWIFTRRFAAQTLGDIAAGQKCCLTDHDC